MKLTTIAVKCISLALITAFTIVEIINKETTVFYIIYLFWFDEFIRTVFDRVAYRFKKENIENPIQFQQQNKERFFLLGVYFIFIVVLFGIIIDWKQMDLIGLNYSVLLFKNQIFNFSLLTIIVREIYLYQSKTDKILAKSVASNGIIILHISIVLGLLIWFLSTQKFQFMLDYSNVISIIPFLLLKIGFELKAVE